MQPETGLWPQAAPNDESELFQHRSLYVGLENGEFQASPALSLVVSVTGTCDVRTHEDVPGKGAGCCLTIKFPLYGDCFSGQNGIAVEIVASSSS